MKGMPFSFHHYQELIESSSSASPPATDNSKRTKTTEATEPRSVLDHLRSPSPSSSLCGGGGVSPDAADVAAISNNPNSTTTNSSSKWANNSDSGGGGGDKSSEWASELQPIPSPALEIGGVDEWDSIISGDGAPVSSANEQTFLRWIMTDIDQQQQQHLDFDNNSGSNLELDGLIDPRFTFESPSKAPVLLPPAPVPVPAFFQEPLDEKPQNLFSQQQHQQHQQFLPAQNPTFFLPQPDHGLILPPNPKRHHSETLAVPARPKDETLALSQQQRHQALVDQLFKAAELMEAGGAFSAREILARLNHQLPASPLGLKPLIRSAFIFKNALHLLSTAISPHSAAAPSPLSSPWDVVVKLSSYKAFSDVSPLIHFTNLAATQILLEETAAGASGKIHIVDFDIGAGCHWSSFMQELALRHRSSIPSLRITAFLSPSTFHPLELHLTSENLSQFAADLCIPFQFAARSLDSLSPANDLLSLSSPDEIIFVNFPISSHYPLPLPTLLHLIRQLNPKLVLSTDLLCYRGDLPFSHHFLHSLQSCMVLLDSLDAAGTSPDLSNKIERFILQPRIESSVLGRYRTGEKMPPWRAVFASSGFVPVQFSNFTEAQAECLLKRVQVRGFHVEKRQSSMFLYWQRGELGSVSAWRCS